eukprot:4016127-Heterocapsa_arctica.AAC.1
MTRQEYRTWGCEHRTGAGHTKCGGKRTCGKLELDPREIMSEAPKTRLLHRKDIFYQVEDN